jgi:hypothetical protein
MSRDRQAWSARQPIQPRWRRGGDGASAPSSLPRITGADPKTVAVLAAVASGTEVVAEATPGGMTASTIAAPAAEAQRVPRVWNAATTRARRTTLSNPRGAVARLGGPTVVETVAALSHRTALERSHATDAAPPWTSGTAGPGAADDRRSSAAQVLSALAIGRASPWRLRRRRRQWNRQRDGPTSRALRGGGALPRAPAHPERCEAPTLGAVPVRSRGE